MAKRERLGGGLSLAAAARLTAGLFLKVAIRFDLAKLPGAGRVFEARAGRFAPRVVPDWSCDP
jgi:hypothetical protein